MSQAAISDNSNTKLGPLIHGWSIPAISTCPGKTTLCSSRCYAHRGFFRMPTVEASHARNYRFSQQPEFVAWMVGVIAAQFVRVMRVHVSGDFYDVEYTRKWLHIIRQTPHVQFFAYTRSWRRDELLPELIQISQEANVHLWWSIDRESGPAPIVRGIRRAYMAINDVDASLAPDDCDLVFRDKPQTVMKTANGIQVCPPENGVKLANKITCSRCGICWHAKLSQWEYDLLPHMDDVPEILVPEGLCNDRTPQTISTNFTTANTQL